MTLVGMAREDQVELQREIARWQRALSTTRLAHRRAWDSLSEDEQERLERERPWVVPGADRRRAS